MRSQDKAEDNAVRRQADSAGVDLARLPAHIAIIMDGNGRWAKARGRPRLMGHREGYRNLRKVLADCSDLGIRYLTVYAFSAENWRRPPDEVEGLMKLLERAARDELRMMLQNNVRMRLAGRIDELSPALRRVLLDTVATTEGNTGIVFTLAVNYGGRAEIVDAVRDLVAAGFEPNDITEELVSAHLYNPDQPEPDLMIRTAGEVRWSNFLLWQGAYCELVVSDVPWPEFGRRQLFEAVATFQHRTRKFGAVVE
ncbi:MAG: di-trans,poly-cis-decaprenylcistransferase [Fimbriimonas ginsengisoli]|uniref:Isoprenyl transferase n=1 Tax=Fimbriimonas ginsengisoli TaxID=1005039 RepID=A0A931LS48_FIMGI|nr:di-trans,poly-cis-decaprenylcistransferase [Fimbriimonas ginsengisoli]MBI3721416.1 di-trans,poly-cis-decaprenylcistransferase [Fimbriimonas ginsengisoli]